MAPPPRGDFERRASALGASLRDSGSTLLRAYAATHTVAHAVDALLGILNGVTPASAADLRSALLAR